MKVEAKKKRRGGNNNPTGKGGPVNGEVRNPNGRPPNTKFFSDYVKQFAGMTKPEILSIANDETRLGGERLAALEFINALEGKDQSVERVLQRTEGKVADKIEHAITSFEEFDESTLLKRGQELASRVGEAGVGAPVPIPATPQEQQSGEIPPEQGAGSGGSGGQS